MLEFNVLGIVAIVYIVGHLLYLVYYAIGLYHLNPFIRLKPLSHGEKVLLAANFPVYGTLPVHLKEKCNERIVWFRSRKKFVFYGDVEKQDELTLILSGTAVLMTLGLNDYKMMRSLLRILIYPSQYYSRINKRHHLGEYNPRLKTVIFSAEKIREGFEVPNDNINLAMHEFAHALSFEMVKKSSWEAKKFKVGLKKIKALFLEESFVEHLLSSQYFRAYGMTNLQEFFSVAEENFLETPAVFYREFPELYAIIRRMLNFDFQRPPISLAPKKPTEN